MYNLVNSLTASDRRTMISLVVANHAQSRAITVNYKMSDPGKPFTRI